MSEDEPPDVIGNDDSSFEDFVEGSSARLFTMARLLTGGNRAEAEDLLQGAYERAYRRWGRISRRADPERYVRQILVNASIDRWRKIRRHPEIPLAVGGADPRTADTAAAVADRDLLIRGLAARLRSRAGARLHGQPAHPGHPGRRRRALRLLTAWGRAGAGNQIAAPVSDPVGTSHAARRSSRAAGPGGQ
jgi:DNA-directed RNA polymerase specialized sigma24 family protein